MRTVVDLSQEVARLIGEPPESDRPFVLGDATVAEVYAMAAWLRARLAGRGAGAVCLAAEDRAVIAAALLASLAGGPVLLLPFAFSAQALAGMHEATGFTVVITDVERDLPPGVEFVCPRRGESGPELRRRAVDPEAELLRLYTGGSTGVPQIWPKTGINLLAEALFLARQFGVTPADRIVATISPYHIYGLLYSVLLPLVSGAAVAPGMPSYPDEIVHAVRDCRASILVSVPAHYRILRGRSAMGPDLRLAFSSAGMLDPDDNRDFCRRNPAGIVEIYGSTETGGIALRHRCRGEGQFTPYPTIAWRIEMERLYIRSPYLSPNLPLQADGAFVTGDRVEAAEGGGFHLRGRADSITKVAGKRVDLEEIAALIRRQPGVTDCLVMALDDEGGREHRIVAVIEGGGVELEALRRQLAGHLEPYARPRVIRVVERMPLKDNGKYDRPAILRLLAP